MSIETKIDALTAAVLELVKVITKVSPANPTVAATPIATAPVQTVAAVTAPATASPSEQSQVVQYAQATAGMPPPPAFTGTPVAPVAAPAGLALPFNDPKGLIDYLMKSYTALGPQKGAQIQGVLVNLGYQNVNDVKPEHYAALYAGVEGLK